MARHSPGGEQKRRRPGYSSEELRHMRALGNAIAALREEETGLSRFQFALEADVHRNSMNALENGNTSAGFLILLRIAETLGVAMSELMAVYEDELARFGRDSSG